MMLMLMEYPSHMGTLHVHTSGHTPVVVKIVNVTMVYTIVHVNKTLLLSLHHVLVLTTTESLVLIYAAMHHISTMAYCGMDSSVVVVRLPAAHTSTCHGSSRHSMRPPLRTLK